MNRFYALLAITLCAASSLLAQPNLRVQTLPAPFSRYVMKVCDTTDIRVGLAGTGQVWNYANLVQRKQDTTVTIFTDRSVLSVPDKFPNGQVVVIDDTTTSVYRKVDGTWRLEGWITPTTEMLVGADPYDVRPVEVVYNNRSFDSFNGTIQSPFPTPGAKDVTGAHAYVYDGFGQLVLPDFTYNNVARTTQHDTMSVEVTLGPQKAFVKTISRKTSWQEVSSNIPLFVIDESSIQVFSANNVSLFGPFLFKTVRYRQYGQTTDVQEDPTHSLQLAPCPSSGDHVTIIGLAAEPITVLLINAIGETITCAATRTEAGMTLDVRNLAVGTYHVLIMDGTHLRSASFVRK